VSRDTRGVFGDHAVRGFEDHLGGAVVLLELHERRAREVVLKGEHVAHVGPAPAIDRLVVVADHAEVAVPPRQLLHEEVLRGVGILELVHQDVDEPVLPVRQPLGVLAEQREGMEQ